MPNRLQAIIWTNADPIHWRTCAARGGDELTHWYNSNSFENYIHKVTQTSPMDLWVNDEIPRSLQRYCFYVLGTSQMASLHRGLIMWCFNTLKPRQNGRHFPDDIFKWIFLSENIWISIRISLKFVPWGQINNIPALVQIMAWRRPGDKPLSEPMITTRTPAFWGYSPPPHDYHWDPLSHIGSQVKRRQSQSYKF